MRSPFLLALSLLLGITNVCFSQYYDSSPSLIMGLEAATPVGGISESHGIGGGGSLKLRIPSGLKTDILITGSLAAFRGKTYGPSKRKAGLAKTASIFVGYRVYLNPLSDYSSFYIQGDGGLSAVTTKIINPAIAPSFGYLVNDKLDIALRYQSILTNNKYANISFISLSIGYGLNLN